MSQPVPVGVGAACQSWRGCCCPRNPSRNCCRELLSCRCGSTIAITAALRRGHAVGSLAHRVVLPLGHRSGDRDRDGPAALQPRGCLRDPAGDLAAEQHQAPQHRCRASRGHPAPLPGQPAAGLTGRRERFTCHPPPPFQRKVPTGVWDGLPSERYRLAAAVDDRRPGKRQPSWGKPRRPGSPTTISRDLP